MPAICAHSLNVLLILLILHSPSKVSAQSEGKPPKTKVALTYYLDTRSFNTLTLLTNTTNLPAGFNIFGFVDLLSEQKNADQRFDMTRYFLEYRLRRNIDPDWIFGLNGVGLETEYNDGSGTNNSVLRFGANYTHEIPSFTNQQGWWQWRYFPVETDGTGTQLGAAWSIPILNWIFISGFADLNINDIGDDNWVIEPQLNFKITETFDLVLEGRFNEIEESTTGKDGLGVSGGIKVKF
jgi:hypothetical protein